MALSDVPEVLGHLQAEEVLGGQARDGPGDGDRIGLVGLADGPRYVLS